MRRRHSSVYVFLDGVVPVFKVRREGRYKSLEVESLEMVISFMCKPVRDGLDQRAKCNSLGSNRAGLAWVLEDEVGVPGYSMAREARGRRWGSLKIALN